MKEKAKEEVREKMNEEKEGRVEWRSDAMMTGKVGVAWCWEMLEKVWEDWRREEWLEGCHER